MIVIPERMSDIEFQEIVERLNKMGWTGLMKLLMQRDSIAYTKNGRLNKSAICRKLKLSNKELESALGDIRREFS